VVAAEHEPELRVHVPTEVDPFLKVAVPVTVAEPEVGATVAVSVTLAPEA